MKEIGEIATTRLRKRKEKSSEWRKSEDISEFAAICLKENGQLTVTRIKGSIEETNLDERKLWINNCRDLMLIEKAGRMKESGELIGTIKN